MKDLAWKQLTPLAIALVLGIAQHASAELLGGTDIDCDGQAAAQWGIHSDWGTANNATEFLGQRYSDGSIVVNKVNHVLCGGNWNWCDYHDHSSYDPDVRWYKVRIHADTEGGFATWGPDGYCP